MITINKQEKDLLSKYFYYAEERLIQAIKDCSYRYVRRDIDSVELLEEIIAKEHLNAFRDFKYDITRLLNLDKSEAELTQFINIRTGEQQNTGADEHMRDLKIMIEKGSA